VKFVSMLICFLGATSTSFADANIPDLGCATSTYQEPTFTETHLLKNGTKLHLCGNKDKSGHYAQLLVEKPGAKPEKSNIDLGGVSEAFQPFDLMYVNTKFTDDGLVVTDLIPGEMGEYVPAYERRIHCARDCVQEKKVKCVFQRLPGKPDEKATAELLSAVRKKNGVLSESYLMDAYRNALTGDKKALAGLLNPAFLKRMDRAYSEEPGEGFAHDMISGTLRKLKKLGCL
jgi:hypothetical protein